MKNKLQNSNYNDFVEYNKCYERGDFKGSEAVPYDLNAVKKWLEIRDSLEYTDSFDGNWCQLKIVKYSSKYGVNYIYIDKEKKLWRTFETADEFYNKGCCHKNYEDALELIF